MPPKVPAGKCSLSVEGLGVVEGWRFENGTRQFCGIPYAILAKRWTRSSLNTSWDGSYHDGTLLGSNCPNPEFEGDDADDLVPVPPFPHFNQPTVDEKTALVMNIALPSEEYCIKCPIFVYVHGGSLLYGGANLPIFDGVNLVDESVALQKPIIVINFNYRVGLGGFLACNAMKDELTRDGHSGCGNFGLTDQQVAFDWIQRYMSSFGGDINNVVAVGESAGGISISNQLISRNPPKFHRAICMSGLASSIPAWTMQQHEDYFRAVCRHFSLEPTDPNILELLRHIPQQELANATPLIQGVPSGTGNPCLDGWFHREDPRSYHPAPPWLKSYMIGDVYHEGVIFHLNVMDDDYAFLYATLLEHVDVHATVVSILEMYGIFPETPHSTLLERFEHMCGDAIFKLPNYVTARCNQRLKTQGELYLYHFDQRSRIQNTFEGTAYHAHELLYLFGNLQDKFNDEERSMAHYFAKAWIDFANGTKPWKPSGKDWQWKIWGPKSTQAVKTELEDEDVRCYSRFEKMLALGEPGVTWKKWFMAIDAICNKRMRMGKTLPTLSGNINGY